MEVFSSLSYFLVFIHFSLSFFYIYMLSNSQKRPSTHESGFKQYPIIGVLPDFLKNRHRFLHWTTEILSQSPTNTAVFSRPGNARCVLTANPANVEYILKTNFANYPKGKWVTLLLEDFLGQGIFNADGDVWKLQRKTASYEFNTKSLRNFVVDNVKVEVSTRLVPFLAKASETKRVLDLQDILERFAFDNICKLAFNVDPACLGSDGTPGDEFMGAFEVAATLSIQRFMRVVPNLWKLENFLNIGDERTHAENINQDCAPIRG